MDTPKPSTSETPAKSQNTLMGALSYLGILVIIPLISDAKNDPFVKFHIKQGLVLLIAYIITGIIRSAPILGWPVGSLLGLACAILMIIGIIHVLYGRMHELPVIGKFASKFHF